MANARPSRFSSRLALALISVGAMLGGCVFWGIDRNIATMNAAATVKGVFSATLPPGRPGFVVLLRAKGDTWERITTRVFYGPAPFEFRTQAGKLRLYAFIDADGNSAWNPKDPSVQLDVVDDSEGKRIDIGSLRPVANGPPPPIPLDFDPRGSPDDEIEFRHGDLARLDAERFTERAGMFGLWQPVDFARKYGLGVSFLDPYDPKKTPVLLVHGAGGAPECFGTLIAHLDRERFQPWVYSYPSGTRLQRAVDNLGTIVDDLHRQLGFHRLLVVGYSMGGLIAHAYAIGPDRSYVRELVTLSAPYGGDETAQVGVTLLPVVPPFFIDMAQDSVFLRSLRKPLPPTLKHVLFFTYEGAEGKNPSDGIVSLRSELEPEAQSAASEVRGFNETHTSLVNSDEMMTAVDAALRSAGP